MINSLGKAQQCPSLPTRSTHLCPCASPPHARRAGCAQRRAVWKKVAEPGSRTIMSSSSSFLFCNFQKQIFTSVSRNTTSKLFLHPVPSLKWHDFDSVKTFWKSRHRENAGLLSHTNCINRSWESFCWNDTFHVLGGHALQFVWLLNYKVITRCLARTWANANTSKSEILTSPPRRLAPLSSVVKDYTALTWMTFTNSLRSHQTYHIPSTVWGDADEHRVYGLIIQRGRDRSVDRV